MSGEAAADLAQIKRAFAVMRRVQNQVNEIRILTDTRSGTVAGFFNDPAAMINAVSQWSGHVEGVYWTLNPVRSDMLARSNNALRERVPKGWSANDTQVNRRLWLPIADIDPDRVKGISSTEKEHKDALELAKPVYSWLISLGIPKESIVVSDSGNGAHVLLAIDLPNDDDAEELVKRCIAACALKFSCSGMIFDLGNYNSSRVWKVYGSKACKGVDMPDRPHRIARILYASSEIKVCPPDPLKKIAALAPAEPRQEHHNYRNGSSQLDIDAFITRHIPAYDGPFPYGKDARIWIPHECVNHPDHGKASYIIQFASGAVAAGCHGNRCKAAGFDWPALREKFEPRYRKQGLPHNTVPVNEFTDEKSSTSQPAKKHHFNLISAHDLLNTEDAEQLWIWEGVLPDGGMSLLVAKPKVGKTTLAFNLAIAVSRGTDFLGRKTIQGPVVYLALEEKRGEMKKKMAAAGIDDETIHFHFGSAPANAMAEVEPLIVETKAKLLVIDILQKFFRLRDLNDYAVVTNALEPLMAAARKQVCHILLTHHAGKADRADGDDILGSTGLLGGVDTSIHIKKRDKRRTFFTIQRYGEDTPETVLELREDGTLEATGSREEVEIKETEPLILTVLKDAEPLAVDALCEAVEKRKALVLKAIGLLIEKKQIARSGSGKKSDPYKYAVKNSVLPFPDTNGNSKTESKNADNAADSKEECRYRDFDDFSLSAELPGTAFSAPKSTTEKAQNGLDSGFDSGFDSGSWPTRQSGETLEAYNRRLTEFSKNR